MKIWPHSRASTFIEYFPAIVAVKDVDTPDPLNAVCGNISMAATLVTRTDAKQKFCGSSGAP